MKKRLFLAAFALVVLISGAYLLYERGFAPSFDKRLQAALVGVQAPHTYVMLDETHTRVSDRSIDIYGLYSLDFDGNSYSTVSTTTLVLPDGNPPKNVHVFTLQHRAIGDDIYVKIETKSPLLMKTIPHSPEWKHFKNAAIPERFVDIAVPGPILDNLSLLGKNGAYLSLRGKPTDITAASTTYHVYSFTLSKKTAEVTTGPLKSLIDMIATGTVDIWVDDTPSVRIMRTSGDNYTATSTIISVNTPLFITPPASVE